MVQSHAHPRHAMMNCDCELGRRLRTRLGGTEGTEERDKCEIRTVVLAYQPSALTERAKQPLRRDQVHVCRKGALISTIWT